MQNLKWSFFSLILIATFGCGPVESTSDNSTATVETATNNQPSTIDNSKALAEAATENNTIDKTSKLSTTKEDVKVMGKEEANKIDVDALKKAQEEKANQLKNKVAEQKDKIETAVEKVENKVVTAVKKAETAVDDAKTTVVELTEKAEDKSIAVSTKVEEKQIEITPPAPKTSEKPAKPNLNHEIWDGLLKKYVSTNGKVNYKGFKSSQAELDAYTALLAANPIKDSWSRNKKLAYWINAYNAFTVKLIVDNYPVSSITDLEGGKPWDKKWIKIGGQTYSLNQIENDIIRPQFKEPRIHFAVNCAAISCPKLLNKAWTPENLESNFEKQTKAFVNNTAMNTISGDKVEISKIFEWYAADFGDLTSFLNKYSSTSIKSGTKINYKEYVWKLNE